MTSSVAFVLYLRGPLIFKLRRRLAMHVDPIDGLELNLQTAK